MREARPFWGHVVLVFLVSLASTPIALLTPVPLKIAVDSVIGSRPVPGWLDFLVPGRSISSSSTLLLIVAGLVVGIAVLGGLRTLAEAVLGAYTKEKLVLAFRTKLFGHGQRVSLAYHDSVGTADSAYRIQYDSQCVQQVVMSGITPLLTAAFTIVMMIFVTVRIDWVLALIALSITPALFGLAWFSRHGLRRGWRQQKAVESRALSVIQEVLTGLRVVKAFAQEDREQARFVDRASESVRWRVRLEAYEGLVEVALAALTAAGAALVLYVGVRHVKDGVLTLGSLLLVTSYLSQLYTPISAIAKSMTSLQSSLASAERAFSLLDEFPDVSERPDAQPVERSRGAVSFRNVTFEYEPDRPVLKRVSVDVPAGTRVGIAGPTGAGKTTLIGLLSRLYDPTEGEITLDGTDLRDLKLVDLRNQFGIVLQDTILFSTSIRDNIAYAKSEADEEAIVEAARAAKIHDFICSLPDGYDTQVGERGMRLSGGERQRVALARAFLKDAPILILDEPTSSVDVKTEAGIMETMGRLMEGRTTFMIAHRLGTLEHCELRFRLEDGRLVAEEKANDIADTARAPGTIRREQRRARRKRLADSAPDQHPAFVAWRSLWPDSEAPATIEVLKKRPKLVCRLGGVGPEGRPVIAKERSTGSGNPERTLYERVLPRLDVPVAQYYGFAEEVSGQYGWLFLEDVVGEEYSHSSTTHRTLAARWLAALHESTAAANLEHSLPDRGVGHYLRELRSAQQTMRDDLGNRPSSGLDRDVLAYALRRCADLESQWGTVEGRCDGLPETLVHGDLARHNVRLRTSSGVKVFVPFDWGEAGWGIPAVDLAQSVGRSVSPDLAVYAERICRVWPELGMAEVQRLASLGSLFRAVAAISWVGVGLPLEQVAGSLRSVWFFTEKLESTMRENDLELSVSRRGHLPAAASIGGHSQ
jgi:ATP-binding cassette subfamily B protein